MRRSAAQGWRDLRGCAFEHTAACESYFAQRLHDAMEAHGVRGCNLPLGHFEYSTSAAAAPASSSSSSSSSLSLSSSSLSAAGTTPAAEASSSSSSSEAADSAPTACCIVMRTLGDRRLGSHVLAGVALLLDRLVSFRSGDDDGRGDESAQAASASANLHDHELTALFPRARPRDAAELGGVVTAEQLMSDHQMAQGMQYFADANDDATATGLAFAQPRTAALFANALRLDFSRAVSSNTRARTASADTAAQFLSPLAADSAAAMDASRVAITSMREVSPDASQLPDQCTADAGFVACDPRWAQAWAQTCETLRQRLDRLAQRRDCGGNRHACFVA